MIWQKERARIQTVISNMSSNQKKSRYLFLNQSKKVTTGIIIQARVGSTRLPFKVILPFYRSDSIIEILIRKLKAFSEKIPVILATSDQQDDDVLCKLAENMDIECFRGPEDDVLERFILVAESRGFDRIIRICADNPLLDVEGTMALIHGDQDYVAYRIRGDVPSIKSHLGFWGEVVSLEALRKVRSLTSEKLYREHVTNYIYTHPDEFDIKWIDAPGSVYNRTDIRLTIDDEIDFKLGKEIYAELGTHGLQNKLEDVIAFVDKHPSYLDIMQSQIEKYTK